MCDLSAEVAILPGPYFVLISRIMPPRPGGSHASVSWLLKIRGAPPRKGDRKNRIQVLISVLAVLLRTGYGLLRNSGPRVENTPELAILLWS